MNESLKKIQDQINSLKEVDETTQNHLQEIFDNLVKFDEKFQDVKARMSRMKNNAVPAFKAANKAHYDLGIEAEQEIPEGDYCYKIIKINRNEQGVPSIKTKTCPFWAIDPEDSHNGYCAILGECDNQSNGFSLLWDKVKECGLNNED